MASGGNGGNGSGFFGSGKNSSITDVDDVDRESLGSVIVRSRTYVYIMNK